MSENRWLIGVVAVLLLALVGLVCIGAGALFYCPQPGSVCAGLFGGATANNPVAGSTSPATGSGQNSGQNNQVPQSAPQGSNNGRVLRLPGTIDPITLDPATVGDVDSSAYVVEIYSG
ncbi:MAG: hypothetical protein ACM3JD_11400, partial [Rudaea sp.]